MDRYLIDECQGYYATGSNVAMGSANSWYGLNQWPIIQAVGPKFITIDGTNDSSNTGFGTTGTSLAYRSMEALIRRVWTLDPSTQVLGLMFPKFSDNADASVNSPINLFEMNQNIALYAYYGIPYIDYWTTLKDLINNQGHHLSEYYEVGDAVHPLEAGHNVIFGLVLPYLPAGGAAAPSPLPARIYDNGDLENNRTTKLGTGYDSKSGTWTEAGGRISGTSTSATVTYSATCCSFGTYRSDAGNNSIDVSIDGGDYVSLTLVSSKVGVEISGVRAAHTIVIKPRSGTVIIDEMWFI